MKLKYLLAVPMIGSAVMFAAIPAAQAMTLNPANSIEDAVLSNNVADSPAYDLQEGPYFWGAAFKSRDDAGKAIFRFENTFSTSQDVAVSLGTVLQGFGGKFKEGVTIKWAGGESIHIAAGLLGLFEISKTLAAGEVGILKIIFGDPTSNRRSSPGIQMQVSSTVAEVPLPPAILLLLSGLFGVGLLGRSRKSASAN